MRLTSVIWRRGSALLRGTSDFGLGLDEVPGHEWVGDLGLGFPGATPFLSRWAHLQCEAGLLLFCGVGQCLPQWPRSALGQYSVSTNLRGIGCGVEWGLSCCREGIGRLGLACFGPGVDCLLKVCISGLWGC